MEDDFDFSFANFYAFSGFHGKNLGVVSPRQLRQSTQRIEKMTVETEAFLEDVEAGRVIIRNVVLCHLQSGGTFALGVSGKKSTTFKTKFTIWRGPMISIIQ